MASTLRAEDTVARFGGDELVVLSEHITGGDDVRGIAQRILDALREPIALDGETITLSASIGICVAPVEGPTREELLSAPTPRCTAPRPAGRGATSSRSRSPTGNAG